MNQLERQARDALGERFGYRKCWITLAGDGTWSFDWMRPHDESWEPKRRAESIDEVFRVILETEASRAPLPDASAVDEAEFVALGEVIP